MHVDADATEPSGEVFLGGSHKAVLWTHHLNNIAHGIKVHREHWTWAVRQ